jgi:hypothetical protein
MFDLATMTSRIEIEELAIRYCHLLDHGRGAEVPEQIFTEDGVLCFGAMRLEGRAAIGKTLADASAAIAHTSHNVTNLLIVVDGNTARANFRLLAFHWFKGVSDNSIHPNDLMTVGGYEDELMKTADGWRVKFRRSYALGSGIGMGQPLPEQRKFFETLSEARGTWR